MSGCDAKRVCNPAPLGESGGASGVAGFSGTRLQDLKGPKLGGSRSEARQGRSPKLARPHVGRS